MRVRLITVASIAVLTLAACGGSPPPDGHTVRPDPTRAVQPPRLMPGMGSHHHAIATASPEARSASRWALLCC